MSWRRALCGCLTGAWCVAFAACAQGQDGIDLGAADGAADPDGGGSDVRVPPRDSGGGGPDDSSAPDKPSPDECPAPAGCTGKVVINELMTRGPGGATDEFVELYNPNSCAVSLGGWKLAYKSKTGTGNTVLHTFAVGDSVAAGAFLVLGTSSFSAKKDATMNSGMADEGQVGLVDDGNVVVDAVGYGAATTGTYVEKTPASAPPSNGSIGRKCGVDTDKNSADFAEYTQHSAGAPNP